MNDTPLLMSAFSALRERGFPLGVADYQLLLEGIAAGFAETAADLRFLCQTLWAKSPEEQEIVAAVLDVVLPQPVAEPAPTPTAEEPAQQRAAPPAPARGTGETTPAASTTAHLAQRLGMVRAGAATAGALAASLVKIDGRPVSVHPGMILAGDLPITRRHMKRAWRHHRRMQRRGVPTEIDVPATIAAMARTGIFLAPVLVPRRVNFARLLILQDEGGSMTPFRRITRPLLESALQGGLARVDVAWFHDVPGATLHRDDTLNRPVPFGRVVEPFRDASALIVSDGGAARGRLDPRRVKLTLDVLRRLRAVTQNIAWLNPTPPERWPGTTAGEIADAGAVPMFPLNRRGLDAAVDVLRGRLPSSR